MSDSDDSSDNSYHEEGEQDDSGDEGEAPPAGGEREGSDKEPEVGEEEPSAAHQGPPQKPRVAGRKGTKRMLVRI